MAFYQLIRTQRIPASLDTVWDFISRPGNLKDITPPDMGFDITSQHGDIDMYPGMIISYRVTPLPGFRTNWVTEITHVRDREYFVDEQRVGPYTMWHHQHRIETIPGGVCMTDIVSYVPPFGIIGAIANQLFIRRRLENIFSYRTDIIEKKFGIYPM